MENPFLNDNFLINWSELSLDHLVDDVTLALKRAEVCISEIENIDLKNVTYRSVAEALEDASSDLDRAWSVIEHLTNVQDSAKLREEYKKVLPQVTGFYAGICLRPKLWKVVKALSESDELSSLKPVQKRYVDELVQDFLECGANLNDDQRARVKEIDNRLAEITQKYSENVLDSTNDWEKIIDDEAVLAEFPDVLKEIAKSSALEKGIGTDANPKWRFTLHAPSIFPYMKYITDESLRKEAWLASGEIGKKGDWDNSEIIREIIQLRAEKADILGHRNFADMVLKRRMAKNGDNARNFIRMLKDAAHETMERDVEELEEFQAQELNLVKKEKLEPWDISYWSEKMLKKKHSFDDELLRPYFSVDNVLSGLFEIAEKVFGLKLIERETCVGKPNKDGVVEVWTEQVQFYDMYDRDSGNHMGGFYTDWFPRESKRSGAWMDCLKSGVFGEDGQPKERALGILCGNMTPGNGGKPALLTHGEVETVFHEFGHLIHELCGEVEVKSLNGISVPWDFVELPSQMMENWCWQRESLDIFAKHVDSGECITEDLFDKMQATRNFQKGLATMRQLSFGIMDLDLHIDFDANDEENDLDSFVEQSTEAYKPVWKHPTPGIVRRFGHLFSSGVGYAAGYYSYQWSEVLEADAFGMFLENGILDGESGMKFRKSILSVGNRLDAMDAYENFRGRKPTLESYLKRADMVVTEESKKEFGV